VTDDGQAYDAALRIARFRIDKIDDRLVALLLQRLRVTVDVGMLRRDHRRTEVGATDRGAEILRRYADTALKLDTGEVVSLAAVGKAILSLSASTQRTIMGLEN
jgi:chorismate mutase